VVGAGRRAEVSYALAPAMIEPNCAEAKSKSIKPL
jgi:hypothetical protein